MVRGADRFLLAILTLLSALFFSCVVALPAARAAPVLERVVMLSRHGVRSPLRTMAMLQALTRRDWPTWPVGPGEMTEHGAKNLAFMGDFLRDRYAGLGALPNEGCPAPGMLAIWSDVADGRTRESGRILAERLAPGCRVAPQHAPDGSVDALFDATRSSVCAIGDFKAAGALISATKNDGEMLRDEDRHALETLQDIVAPNACKTDGPGICLVPTSDRASLRGAAQLALGSVVAEAIYLEYVQGFPARDVGWGKAADPATIAAIVPAHERGTDIRRRTAVLAARRGAVMAKAIFALLAGEPAPAAAPPAWPRDAKIVMIAGHDSNLLYMAALMGLDWRLPNQPSVTPPDATLAFEVWHDQASGLRTLKVVIYAQTLAQLREATPLDAAHPPDIVPIVPQACAGDKDGCPLSTFIASADRDLERLCGK